MLLGGCCHALHIGEGKGAVGDALGSVHCGWSAALTVCSSTPPLSLVRVAPLLSLSFPSSPFCCRGQRAALLAVQLQLGWAASGLGEREIGAQHSTALHRSRRCRFVCACALARSFDLLFVAVPLTRSEDDSLTTLTGDRPDWMASLTDAARHPPS